MDEHRRAVSQSSGDVLLLLPTLLYRYQECHQSLSRDSGRGSAGHRAEVQWFRYRIQRYALMASIHLYQYVYIYD